MQIIILSSSYRFKDTRLRITWDKERKLIKGHMASRHSVNMSCCHHRVWPLIFQSILNPLSGNCIIPFIHKFGKLDVLVYQVCNTYLFSLKVIRKFLNCIMTNSNTCAFCKEVNVNKMCPTNIFFNCGFFFFFEGIERKNRWRNSLVTWQTQTDVVEPELKPFYILSKAASPRQQPQCSGFCSLGFILSRLSHTCQDYSPGPLFISLGTTNIFIWITLCYLWHPMYCRMLSSIPDLYPWDSSNISL